MRKLLYILAIAFSLVTKSYSQVDRFATTSGSSSNNGETEATAWSLSYGLSQLAPGMTLNVKAGNYGPLQYIVNVDGTASQPIQIIGYKNTPGDIVATNGTTLFTGGMPSTTESPVIVGTTSSDRPNQDNGLIFNSDWLVFKNFASFGYSKPLQFYGSNQVIDNVYSYKSGTHNPADQGGFGTTFPTGPYTGWGIIITGTNHLLSNSYVLDAGAEGIKIYDSNNFVHRNNKVHTISGVGPYYGDPTLSDGNSTDYHYLIGGNCDGGRFYDIEVEQKTGMYSDGHGIVFKSPNSTSPINDMIVDGFYVKNSKIETQFPNVTNITFKNGEVTTDDTGSYTAGKDANMGNGSRNITLENVRFTGGAHLAVRGWQDIYNETYPYSVENLKILNCYFESPGIESAIWITHGPGNNDTHRAKDVLFDHCTFKNFIRLAYMSSDFENIDFVNSIIVDIPEEYVIGYHDGPGGQGGEGGPYPLVADWSSINIFNSYAPPSGTNITTFDPQLDANSVTTNSSLTTAGVATADYAAGLPIGFIGGSSTPVSGGPSKSNSSTRRRN